MSKPTVSLISYILIVSIHLCILISTQFIDWPELLLYPYLHHLHFELYTQLPIPYQPLSIILPELFFSATSYTVQSLQLFHLLIILILDTLLYLILTKVTSRPAFSFVAMLFFVLLQPTIEGNGVWFDLLAQPWILLSFYLLYRQLNNITHRYNFLVLGLAMGLALMMKQTMVWLLISPSVVGIFLLLKKQWVGLHLLKSVMIALFLPGGMILYYWYVGKLPAYLFWIFGFAITLRNNPDYLIGANITGDILPIATSLLVLALASMLILGTKNRLLTMPLMLWTLCAFIPLFPRWTLTHFQSGLTSLTLIFAITLSRLWPFEKRRLSLIIGVVLIFLLIIKSTSAYVVENFNKEPRFYNSKTKQLISKIRAYTHDAPTYTAGITENFYVYTQTIPPVKPYIQWFPWNFEIEELARNQITSIETNKVPYVVIAPYHPTNPFYSGKNPIKFLSYIEKSYEKIGVINNAVQIYKRRMIQ